MRRYRAGTRSSHRVRAMAVAFTCMFALASPAPAASSGPVQWVGLLSPTSSQITTLTNSSVSRLGVGIGWSNVEPSKGVFNANALGQLQDVIANARSKGFSVVLDLGLQYPPAWVFAVGGQTRFVNQYGSVWHGPSSQDVPNAVFNAAIRSAQADYIRHVATAIVPSSIAGVRIGGLLSGELRYPPATYVGHSMSLWMYDGSAQSNAPYPGWRPGFGTAAMASASLAYYFSSLTLYETWLMQTVNANFPGVNQEVMLPSWGLRPGFVDKAVAAGLRNTTNAEVNGMISEGLEWTSQVRAIAKAGVHGTVYSTWLDAPSQGTTVQEEPPVAYLASLASLYGLPVAGENTGGGGQAGLNLTLQRAEQYHLTGVMYMSGVLIADGSAGISLTSLETSAKAAVG